MLNFLHLGILCCNFCAFENTCINLMCHVCTIFYKILNVYSFFFIETATPSQSLMVLRCCGNLVPEELPENRTILVQQIWQALNKIGMKLFIYYK